MILEGLYTGTEHSYFRQLLGREVVISSSSYWWGQLEYYTYILEKAPYDDNTYLTNTIDDICTFIMMMHDNA